MSKAIVETSLAQCQVINEGAMLSAEVISALEGMGISCQSSSADIPAFLIINSSDSTEFTNYQKLYSQPSWAMTKILLICPEETIKPEDRGVVGAFIKNWVTQTGQDIRLIVFRHVYKTAVTNQSTEIYQLISQLNQGKLPQLTHKTFNSLKADDAVNTILGVWFDRGHKGATVQIQGSEISGEELHQTLQKLHPDLVPGNNLDSRVGENPLGEVKTTSQERNLFIEFLSKEVHINHLSPEPTIKPQQRSILAPRQSPHFQTVVVEEESPPATPAPVVESKPVVLPAPSRLNTARLPLQDEPVAELKKINLPREVKRQPETLEKPVSKPQRKVVKQRKKFALPTRVSMGVVVIALLSLIASLSPLGLLYIQALQAKQLAYTATLEQITRSDRYVDESYATLASYVSLMPQALATPIEGFFSREAIQAKYHILIVKAAQELSTAAKLMMTAAEGDPYIPLQNAKHTLDELYILQSTNPSFSKDVAQLNQARKMISLIPELIPQDKKITILVLLQNNLELRPTGGFIGAVALLTFDHGKLLTIDTRDIYDLDANLKGIVTPPAELKTYLGETSWYFRDANWQPNFKESAATANWFLEKEWGSAAHAVIGVNLNTLKSILTATGPLTLPDGQVMTAENLLVSAFNHQDVPTVKNEAKKQEFLSLFIKPLFDRVAQSDAKQVNDVLKALQQAADGGELTFVSTNTNAQTGLSELGWTGEMYSPPCPIQNQESCLQEFFYVNEANVGINKANYYLKRSHNHEIGVTQNALNHQHQLSITNQSPNDTWPAGIYKAYLRIHVPESVGTLNVSIDGNPLPAEQVTNLSKGSYRVFSHSIEIKPGVTTQLKYTYSTPTAAFPKSYVFGLQKQPGTTSDPYRLTITSPTRSLVVSNTNSSTKEGTSFSGMLDKNTFAAIELH